jgi:hypothetical protein
MQFFRNAQQCRETTFFFSRSSSRFPVACIVRWGRAEQKRRFAMYVGRRVPEVEREPVDHHPQPRQFDFLFEKRFLDGHQYA